MQTSCGCRQRFVGRIDGCLGSLSHRADVVPNCLHAAADAAVLLQPVNFSGFTSIQRCRRYLQPLLEQSQQSEPEIEFAAGNESAVRNNTGENSGFVQFVSGFLPPKTICASCLRKCMLQALKISGDAQRPRQGQELL